MSRLIAWITDAYHKHGVLAALAILVTVVALILGVAYVTGIDTRDIARWISALFAPAWIVNLLDNLS